MLDGIHWQLEEIQKDEGKFRKHKTIFVLVVLLSTMYFIFFRDGLKIYRGVWGSMKHWRSKKCKIKKKQNKENTAFWITIYIKGF